MALVEEYNSETVDDVVEDPWLWWSADPEMQMLLGNNQNATAVRESVRYSVPAAPSGSLRALALAHPPLPPLHPIGATPPHSAQKFMKSLLGDEV